MPDISGSVKKLYQLLINDPDYQDTSSKSREEVVLGEAVQRAKQHERNNIALSLAKAPLIPSTNGHSNGNGAGALGKLTNFLLKAEVKRPSRPPGEGLFEGAYSPKNGITTFLKPLKEDIALREWNKDVSQHLPGWLLDLELIFEGVEVDKQPVNIDELKIMAEAVEAYMAVEVMLGNNSDMSWDDLQKKLVASEVVTFTEAQTAKFIGGLIDVLGEEITTGRYEHIKESRIVAVESLLNKTYALPTLPEGWESKCIDEGKSYRKVSKGLRAGTFSTILMDETGQQAVYDKNGEKVLTGENILSFVKGGMITRGGAEARKNYIQTRWGTLTEALLDPTGRSLYKDMKSSIQGQNAILDLAMSDTKFNQITQLDIEKLRKKKGTDAFTQLELRAIQHYKKLQDNKAAPQDDKLVQFMASFLKEQKEKEGLTVSYDDLINSLTDEDGALREFDQWGFKGDRKVEELLGRFFTQNKKFEDKPMITSAEAQAALAIEEGDITDENVQVAKSYQERLNDLNIAAQKKINKLMEAQYDEEWEDNVEEDSDIASTYQEYQEDPDKVTEDYDALKIRLAKDGVVYSAFNAADELAKSGKEAENINAFSNKYYRKEFADVPANGWLGQEQENLKNIANKLYTLEGVTEVFLYGDSVKDYRSVREQPEEASAPRIGIRINPESTLLDTSDDIQAALGDLNIDSDAVSISPVLDEEGKPNIDSSVVKARYYSPETYNKYKDTIAFSGAEFPQTQGEAARKLFPPFAGNDVVGGHKQQSPLTLPDNVLNSNLNDLLEAEEGVRVTVENKPFRIPLDIAYQIAESSPDMKNLKGNLKHLLGIAEEEDGELRFSGGQLVNDKIGEYAETMADPIFSILEDEIYPELHRAFNPSEREVNEETGKIKYVTQPVDEDTKKTVKDQISQILGESLPDKLQKIKTINHEYREVRGRGEKKVPVATPERREELRRSLSNQIGDIYNLEQELSGEIDYENLNPIVQKLISRPKVPMLIDSGEQAGEQAFEVDDEGNKTFLTQEGPLTFTLGVHRPNQTSYQKFINKEADRIVHELSSRDFPEARQDIMLHDGTGKSIPLAILLPDLRELLTTTEAHSKTWNMYKPVLIHNEKGHPSGRYRRNKNTGEIEHIKPQNQEDARVSYLTELKPLIDAAKEAEAGELEKNWSFGPDLGYWDSYRDPNTNEPLERAFKGGGIDEATGKTILEALGGNPKLHEFVSKRLGLNPSTKWISFRSGSTLGESITGLEVSENQPIAEALKKRLQTEGISGLWSQFGLHEYGKGWSPHISEKVPIPVEQVAQNLADKLGREPIESEINSEVHRLKSLRLLEGRQDKYYEDQQEEVWEQIKNLPIRQRDAVIAQWNQLAYEGKSYKQLGLGLSEIGSGVGMELIKAVIKRVKEYGTGEVSTITLKPQPETPKELAEAQRRIQNRREAHRGRPFEFDLTDPDFQTFIKHLLREGAEWGNTYYNSETNQWEENIPNEIPLSKLVTNAEGIDQEVPIGSLGGAAATLLNVLSFYNLNNEELNVNKLDEGGNPTTDSLENLYYSENKAGAEALLKLEEATADIEFDFEDFSTRVYINHFIRKQLNEGVEEGDLTEYLKPYYNRLLAGLNITEEDIDKGSRRIPDHAPAVLRAYSDADALKHAEDGNLDVDSSYFDSEDTHEYFINRFKPFKILASHLGKDSVRELFEQENLIPITQSHVLQSNNEGGTHFRLVPTTENIEHKINIDQLKTFIRKYMSHSLWGEKARTNADEINPLLKGKQFDTRDENVTTNFTIDTVMPTWYALVTDRGDARQVLRIQKFFNHGFDEDGESIYNPSEGRTHPITGEDITPIQLRTFKAPSKAKSDKSILSENVAYNRWGHEREHGRSMEPATSVIDFTDLNAFLQRNKIGLSEDGVTQELQFNTDVSTDDVDSVREWVNSTRAKIAMLKTMSVPISELQSLSPEDKLYWKALTGTAVTPKGKPQHGGYGNRLDAMSRALGHLTFGEGLSGKYEPSRSKSEYQFLKPFSTEENAEKHKDAHSIFKAAPLHYTGTTYQTNLTYQDDLLARIEKTLGNMPENKLQEIFGEQITRVNRADPLGVIQREINRLKSRGKQQFYDTDDYEKYVNNEINILLNTVYRAIGPYDADTGMESTLWKDQPVPMEQAIDNMKGGDLDALTQAKVAIGEARTDILDKLRGDQVKIAAVMGEKESALTEQQRKVLALRFGLDIDPETGEQTNRSRSLAEVGKELGFTREMIRLIEKKATQKLRWARKSKGHPAFSGLDIAQEEHSNLTAALKTNTDFLRTLNSIKPEDILAGNIDPAIQEQLNAIVGEAAPYHKKFPDFFRKDGVWREFDRPFEQGAGPLVLGDSQTMEGLPIAPIELILDPSKRRNLINNSAFSPMIMDVDLNEDDPKAGLERYHIRIKEGGKLLGHLLRDNGTYSVWRVGDFLESVGGIVNTSAPVEGASPILEGLSSADAYFKVKNEIEWVSPTTNSVTGMVLNPNGVGDSIENGVAIPPHYSPSVRAGVSGKVIDELQEAGVSPNEVEEIKKGTDGKVTTSSTSVDPETGIGETIPHTINRVAKKAVERGTPEGVAENRLDQWGGEKTIRGRATKWIEIINGGSHDITKDHAIPMLRHLTEEGGYLGLNVQNLMDISNKFVDVGLHGGWRADGKVTAGSTDHEYSGMSAFLSRLDNLIAGNDVELVKSEKEKNTNNTAFLNKIRGILYEIDLKNDDGTEYSLEKVMPGGGQRDLYNPQVQEATSGEEERKIRTKDTTGGFVPSQIAQEIERLRDPKEFPENQELTTDDLRKQAIQTMDKDNKIGGIGVAPWKVSKDTAKAILARVATQEDTDFRKLVESNKIDAWHPWLYLTKTDLETGKQVYNEDFLGMTNDKIQYLFSQLIGEDGQVKHHDSILGHVQPAIEDWTKHNFQAWDKSNYGPRDEEHEQFGKLPRILREHQINGVLDKMAEGTFGETDDIRLSNQEIHKQHMAEFTKPEVQSEVVTPEVEPEVQPTEEVGQQVDPIQTKFDFGPMGAGTGGPTDDDGDKIITGDGEEEDKSKDTSWDNLSTEQQAALEEKYKGIADMEPIVQEGLIAAAGFGGDSRKEPPTGPDVVSTSEDNEVVPELDPKKLTDIANIMNKRFGAKKDEEKNIISLLDEKGNLKEPNVEHQDYLDYLKTVDDKKFYSLWETQYIHKLGEATKTPEVDTTDLKRQFTESYKKYTTSPLNPDGIEPVTIPENKNELERRIADFNIKIEQQAEQAIETEYRKKANDLSNFIPEGGIPEGLSPRVLKQLARKAFMHQAKYDTLPDSKGKPYMENDPKRLLNAFWEDVYSRTDSQGNQLIAFEDIQADFEEANHFIKVKDKEGKERQVLKFEDDIEKEDIEMGRAEENYKALTDLLNKEGVEAITYPINGHNILVSADGHHEREFGADGEYTQHEYGRNRDYLTGNLLDKYGEQRSMQAPQIFGLNFANDEDKIRFKELWNNYYQISNTAVRAYRGQESAGYAIEQQRVLGKQIVDEYGPKGFEADWLEAAHTRDQHGDASIERNKLGFPVDKEGKPLPLPKVIDPETGEEVDGWYSPALHAVVNERYLRTLFQESTKHKTNPLYGDHNQIKITPADLRRRGAKDSVGANLDMDNPKERAKLQLIQPLDGSPLHTDKAVWFTREGGIYNVPSLENFTPPSIGPIDSAEFRRLALMHKVADEMAKNPEAFTGQMADLSGYSGMQEGPLDAQQWAGDQEAMAKTPTVKRMVRNSPSAKQTIKEQTDNLQASPTARFLASLGGYTKETAGRVPKVNLLAALARDTMEGLTGKRGLIPATQSQQNIELLMGAARKEAEQKKAQSETAKKYGLLDSELVVPVDPKEKQVGVGEMPEAQKHPFEDFKPENVPEVENPFRPIGSAVGELGRFARRKPKSESITPPPSMPVEGE